MSKIEVTIFHELRVFLVILEDLRVKLVKREMDVTHLFVSFLHISLIKAKQATQISNYLTDKYLDRLMLSKVTLLCKQFFKVTCTFSTRKCSNQKVLVLSK